MDGETKASIDNPTKSFLQSTNNHQYSGYKSHQYSGYKPVPTSGSPSNTKANSSTFNIESGIDQPQFSTFNIESRTDQPETPWLDRFLSWFMILLLVFGFCLLSPWIFFTSEIPEFDMESVSLSPFNLSTSHVSSKWNISFTLTNPNEKTTLHYHNVELMVLYKGEILHETTLAPFLLGKEENLTVRTSFDTSFVTVEKWVSSSIARDMDLLQAVTFNVKVKSWIVYQPRRWWEDERWMTVSCENVKIEFPSKEESGAMCGGSRKCEVILQNHE